MLNSTLHAKWLSSVAVLISNPMLQESHLDSRAFVHWQGMDECVRASQGVCQAVAEQVRFHAGCTCSRYRPESAYSGRISYRQQQCAYVVHLAYLVSCAAAEIPDSSALSLPCSVLMKLPWCLALLFIFMRQQ